MTNTFTESEIERVEHLRCTAMLSRDVDTLNRVLHDKRLCVHSSGDKHIKTSDITRQVRDEFATKDARAARDTMTPDAYVSQLPDGAFERRFCGVLVALIWVITSIVIACLVVI